MHHNEGRPTATHNLSEKDTAAAEDGHFLLPEIYTGVCIVSAFSVVLYSFSQSGVEGMVVT